ncbi:MAG: GTP 3',8-cyclase MoaA [Candidatus Melainabacteria bacterium]|nr:GTP 3',8-cyclase MoaA [Candidatus Melainabacteria bacterium]
MNRLIDPFGRQHTYLRISVTDRCNMRCFYCMPGKGLEWKDRSSILTFEELERVSRIVVKMGINKIRLTGGEPLLRRGLELLVGKLRSIEGLDVVAMTTNGLLLGDHARMLRQAGLTHLNVSLDSLRPDRFRQIVGLDEHHRVMAGLKEARAVNFRSLKINVVVIDGVNDDEILDFVDLAIDWGVNVRFIEFMPFKNNNWEIDKVVTYQQMLDLIASRHELIPLTGEPSSVARDFRIQNTPGVVSFVTSMSESFCSTCSRLRLTADGSIKTCLFDPAEISIRQQIREGATDAEIADAIQKALEAKPEAHPPAREIASGSNRSMIDIGG